MIKKFEEFVNEGFFGPKRHQQKIDDVTKINRAEFNDIIDEILDRGNHERKCQPTIITNLNALGSGIFDELKDVFATRCAFVTDLEDFKKFEQDLEFREDEYFVIGIKDIRGREGYEMLKKSMQVLIEYGEDDSAKRTNSSVMLMFGDDFKYVYDEISNVIKDRLSRKRILEIE